jgi:hypothetical protein
VSRGDAVASNSAATRWPGPCDDTATTKVPQPAAAHLRAAGLGELPIAPDEHRVDLIAPPFSDPTNVTNPLFPISKLHSVVLNTAVTAQQSGKARGAALGVALAALDLRLQ